MTLEEENQTLREQNSKLIHQLESGTKAMTDAMIQLQKCIETMKLQGETIRNQQAEIRQLVGRN